LTSLRARHETQNESASQTMRSRAGSLAGMLDEVLLERKAS